MGWVACMAPCIACGTPFSFNPHKVPSIPVRGVREPVCRRCIEAANPRRIALGLEPITPDADAYEAIPEEEL